MYADIIENNCIPLSEIPIDQQEKYLKDYFFHDLYVDIDLMQEADPNAEYPYLTLGHFFNRTALVRKTLFIQKAYAGDRTVTEHLKTLAEKNNITYRTLMRERNRFMQSTSLMNLLSDPFKGEDTKDRYRTCCFYCRDYIIARHESAGKPSDNTVFRETQNLSTFPCSKCPYHPDVKKSATDFIPAATCHRNVDHMVTPNNRVVVNTITSRIPEQETYMAWNGVRAWKSVCQHTTIRVKPNLVNYVHFSDHHCLDIFVKTKVYKDGTFDVGRIWITGIMDCASDALVGYVLSTNPNSHLIAQAFASAVAFKPDVSFCGIPVYMYVDNGKDYRSELLRGLPHNGNEPPLFLNKEFSESGILEWFGITKINATVYNGRAKPIERVWRILEDEFICKMNGYCGNKPENRPASLEDDLRAGNIYTMEQFVDIFADVIFPGYNNFKAAGEKESPLERYNRLPKAKTIVPSWRTLAVLKKKKQDYAVHSDGIHFGTDAKGKPNIYWHPALSRFIRSQKPYERVTVYAFDEPFNRSIAVVYGSVFIGEAFLVHGLNMVEEKRYRVIQHLQEQALQLKTYSSRIKTMHNIVIKNNLVELGTGIPAIDNVAYGQVVIENAPDAIDDNRIPEELKDLAVKAADYSLAPKAPDIVTEYLRKLAENT